MAGRNAWPLAVVNTTPCIWADNPIAPTWSCVPSNIPTSSRTAARTADHQSSGILEPGRTCGVG